MKYANIRVMFYDIFVMFRFIPISKTMYFIYFFTIRNMMTSLLPNELINDIQQG